MTLNQEIGPKRKSQKQLHFKVCKEDKGHYTGHQTVQVLISKLKGKVKYTQNPGLNTRTTRLVPSHEGTSPTGPKETTDRAETHTGGGDTTCATL